jgi:hypothetical protein
MANRFGASSLTALLAVAGMVGVGVVGYRAMNASTDGASIKAVSDEACPLMGGDCSGCSSTAKTSCCSEEAACEDKATECKNLTDGCNGDGQNGCCGGCADESRSDCCKAEKADCGDKAACSEKSECDSEKASCSEESAEEKKACCSQGN